MNIHKNKHKLGQLYCFTFGLCSILDGLVRVISLGYLFSTFCLSHSRNAVIKHNNKKP